MEYTIHVYKHIYSHPYRTRGFTLASVKLARIWSILYIYTYIYLVI